MNAITKFKSLEETLKEGIMGQDHVVERVADYVKNGELGLTDEDEPRGSFLFLGPTGTGKTELVKQLTEAVFGNHKEKMIRFDMSEYMSEDSITKLIGDHTGYEGQLGNFLLDNKDDGGVILFDEMEKAAKPILDVFLQILDDARITTGQGTLHSLNKFYIILTSNIGANQIMKATKLSRTAVEKMIIDIVIAAGYRPEFLGRFNDVIVYNKLSLEVIRTIGQHMIKKELKRLKKEKNIDIVYDSDFLELAVMMGSDTRLGARPMRSFVNKSIRSAIREKAHSLSDDEAGQISNFQADLSALSGKLVVDKKNMNVSLS